MAGKLSRFVLSVCGVGSMCVALAQEGVSIGQLYALADTPTYTMSPSGDTTGAKDLAAINAIENSAAQGASIYWRNGVYYFNGPIVVTATQQTWIGQSSTPTMGTSFGGGSTNFPVSPYLAGVVLEQVTGGDDIIDITGVGATFNISNFGLTWAPSVVNSNTGDGINCTPSHIESGHRDTGLTWSYWTNINCYGVDGSHWGFVFWNTLYDELHEVNQWGGGCMNFTCDAVGGTNYGNIMLYSCYGFIDNAGSVDAIDLSSANGSQVGGGCLNYVCFQQCEFQIEGAAEWNGQKAYNDFYGPYQPTCISMRDTDFEPCNILQTWTCTEGATLPAAGQTYTTNSVTFTVHSATASGGTWRIVTTGRGISAAGAGTLTKTSAGTGDATIAFTAVTNQPEFDYAQGTYMDGAGGQNFPFQLGNSFGRGAGNNNATGVDNTAFGALALQSVTTGHQNTALGIDALDGNTIGSYDTAVGSQAGKNGTGGNSNVYVGYQTAYTETASNNTVVGASALYTMGNESNNSVFGNSAINLGTGGPYDAFGQGAGQGVTTATNDFLFGFEDGYNPGGGSNTANASKTGSQITGVGQYSGNADAGDYSYTTWLGFESLVKGNYATALGWKTVAGAAGAVAIGVDHTGASASTTTQDRIALGTSNHTVYIAGATTHVGAVTQLGAVVETPVGETASFTTGSAAFYNITGAAAGQTVTMSAGPTAGMHVTITNHANQSWTVAPNAGQAINQTTWVGGVSTVYTGSLMLVAGAKVTFYTPDGVNWDCE